MLLGVSYLVWVHFAHSGRRLLRVGEVKEHRGVLLQTSDKLC